MTRIYMINFSQQYLFSENEAWDHPDWNSKGCLEQDTLYDIVYGLNTLFDEEYAKLEKYVSAAEKKWEILNALYE